MFLIVPSEISIWGYASKIRSSTLKYPATSCELILASRFACELSDLGFSEKLNRFERLNRRSEKITTNTLHLSLNFSPEDQIDTEKMQAIALDYMRRIGFGDQPFLVYRHDDTDHPHLHVVSSIIQPNGRGINVHNIGKRKSEPVRQAIEKEYGLIPAESRKKGADFPLSKTSLTSIVREVTAIYHFGSLQELNAILKDFNVTADIGRPGTRMRAKGGLLYWKLDERGNKTGVPVKASSIYLKPTLAELEKKFEKGNKRKHLYAARATKWINALVQKPGTISEEQFKRALKPMKITADFVRDQQGQLVDLVLVDHYRKVALRCIDLNVPIERIASKLISIGQVTPSQRPTKKGTANLAETPFDPLLSVLSQKLLQGLLANEHTGSGVSPEFLKKKKKRRKRP